MSITLREVAERAGVSLAAASSALSGSGQPSVSERTIRRVRAAAAELGYRPNPIARALVSGRTEMVLLSVPGLDHPYVPDLLDRFQTAAEGHDHHVITAQAGADPATQHARLDALEHFVDGIVLADLQAVASTWPHQGTPVVSVGVFYSTEVDWVGIDLMAGVRAAVHHLLHICDGPLWMLAPEGTFRLWDARHSYYGEAMRAAGREPTYVLSTNTDAEDGYRALRDHIERAGLPDGVFCNSDHLALGAYRALLDVGACIPDDVAVVACDGISESSYLNPPLATIVQPLEEAAQCAWDLLRRRLDEPDGSVSGRLLQAPFELRGSAMR